MSNPRRVIGIDPSFSGFGISDGERTISFAAKGVTIREKCASIFAQISNFLSELEACEMLWMVEAPIIGLYGTKQKLNVHHIYNMGHLMSHIYDLAEQCDATIIEVEPGKLKIFTTGHGGSNKIDMGTHSFEKWGLRFRNDNECDAHALFQYGQALLRGENPGVRTKPLPKKKKG